MQSPLSFLEGVKHPEAFHGKGKSSPFFEGWYVKLVSADLSQRWAVIPGIFKGIDKADSNERQSKDEAFIQVLDGSTGRSWFHSFDSSEFKAASDKFEVQIGNNFFSETEVRLDLPQLQGTISITTPFVPWPVTLRSPGIMGWYGLVPFMECFHGIVSFGHQLEGALKVEGKEQSFSKGKGYIETDWGKGFPSGYIWMQTNHFDFNNETSLIASCAIIPWIGKSFRGFIMGLMHEEKLYSWTTYNGAKELELRVDDTHVYWQVAGPDGTLDLKAERTRGGLLHAPLHKDMHRRVEETMDSTVEITLTDNNGKQIVSGTGTAAALEIFGELEKLLAYKK
jgi:tocopherol cyclase